MVYPITSITIHLDEGKIKKIESDGLGSACGGGENPTRVGGTYSFIENKDVSLCPYTCTTGDNDTGKCDPKIFITWIGTDKEGSSLISSGQKLTKFENYNLEDMYSSILKVNTDPMVDDKAIRYDPNLLDADVNNRIDNPPPTPN